MKTSTKIIEAGSQPEEFFAEENIYGRILSDTPSSTAVLARLRPGEAQTHHVQYRPDNGDELLFFYQGTFEVRLKESCLGPYEATPEKPVFVYVRSGDELSIKNLGASELYFFTVLAPGYKDGEIVYVR